jgi:transcriptional regulator with XRE-family HTH domain
MTEQTPGGSRQATIDRVAAEVRAALAWRGINGSEAAREIGVTQPYLSRRLNREVQFGVCDLVPLAALLGVTAGQLVDGTWRTDRKGDESQTSADPPAAPIY